MQELDAKRQHITTDRGIAWNVDPTAAQCTGVIDSLAQQAAPPAKPARPAN